MEEDIKSLGDYWAIVKRRRYCFAFPFGAILILSVLAALFLPAVFRSEGIILVESQQIPTDFIRSTITSYAEERIQIIKQIVMTRENLGNIIKKHHLYEEEAETVPVSQLVNKIHKHLFVELVDEDVTGAMRRRRGTPTITFRVAFEHPVPEVTQSVTSELVTLFLNENLKTRTARATETTEFLAQEADKLKKELDVIESQVAEYKQQYKDSLPENLDLNIQMLERARMSHREIERDIKAEEEQKTYLEVELASLQSALPAENEEPATPGQRLAALRARLKSLTAVYGPAHPDIKAAKRQIAELEEQMALPLNTTDNVQMTGGSPAIMLIQARISSSNSKSVSLNHQRQEIESKIEVLEQRILTTPQVERGLKVLERDYENIKERYEELKEKETEARLSLSMEEQSKAERFSLLEPPQLPIDPVKPSRLKILLLGIILSFSGGLGTVLLREGMDKSIHGARHLARIMKQEPLVTIGYIETKEDIERRKQRIKLAFISIAFVMIAVGGIILAHHYIKST